MSLWTKQRGTTETIFQIGVGGPQVKANGGVVELRNAADSALAVVRGAAPTGADGDQLVTLNYVDTLGRPMFVTAQADGADAIGANTATAHYIVVTTTGGVGSIGEVYYDDGSGVGNWDILAASDGRLLAIKAALGGGTITFAADTLYIWDADGAAWQPAAGVGTLSGAERVIRYALNNTAAQDSVTTLPAGARVTKCRLEIATAYTAGSTISVGQVGAVAAFMATTDNDAVGASAGDAFVVEQDTAVDAGILVVRTTVVGAPAAGAGLCSIWYTVPNL